MININYQLIDGIPKIGDKLRLWNGSETTVVARGKGIRTGHDPEYIIIVPLLIENTQLFYDEIKQKWFTEGGGNIKFEVIKEK